MNHSPGSDRSATLATGIDGPATGMIDSESDGPAAGTIGLHFRNTEGLSSLDRHM